MWFHLQSNGDLFEECDEGGVVVPPELRQRRGGGVAAAPRVHRQLHGVVLVVAPVLHATGTHGYVRAFHNSARVGDSNGEEGRRLVTKYCTSTHYHQFYFRYI